MADPILTAITLGLQRHFRGNHYRLALDRDLHSATPTFAVGLPLFLEIKGLFGVEDLRQHGGQLTSHFALHRHREAVAEIFYFTICAEFTQGETAFNPEVRIL